MKTPRAASDGSANPDIPASLAGRICTDESSIMGASTNFGGCISYLPKAIIRPRSAHEISALVAHARSQNEHIAVRGAGHSQGAQNLCDGGFVLSTASLNSIYELDKERGFATVGAGALWGDLVAATERESLLPPVLTDNLAVTIGGTLSVAGLGPASFHRGTQAHHCRGVEVVLGTGEARWVTPETDYGLFHAILGGLGQFGVVTKANLALRRRLPFVAMATYHFASSRPFLNAVAAVFDAHRAGELPPQLLVEGSAVPSGRDGTLTHEFVLELAYEVEQSSDDTGLSLPLADANTPVDYKFVETASYVSRTEDTFKSPRYANVPGLLHPWVESLLPFDAVTPFLEQILPSFADTPVLLWPMMTEPLRRVNFRLPKSSEVMLVGIMAAFEASRWNEMAERLRRASSLGTHLGGKRYLSGWFEFDAPQWEQHYEEEWESRETLRRQYDPDSVWGRAVRTRHAGSSGTAKPNDW